MGQDNTPIERLEELRAQIAEFRDRVDEFRRELQEAIEVATMVRERLIAERIEQAVRRDRLMSR